MKVWGNKNKPANNNSVLKALNYEKFSFPNTTLDGVNEKHQFSSLDFTQAQTQNRTIFTQSLRITEKTGLFHPKDFLISPRIFLSGTMKFKWLKTVLFRKNYKKTEGYKKFWDIIVENEIGRKKDNLKVFENEKNCHDTAKFTRII